MSRRRPPDDWFEEQAAAARGERVTLYGVDPAIYARRLAQTIDDVDTLTGEAVVQVLQSIANYKRDLGAALAFEQRKGTATDFRIDNVDRINRQIGDATLAWIAQAQGLTADHLARIADMGFDYLPTAIRRGGGVPVRDPEAYGGRNQWAKNEFDIEVPSVSRRQLVAAFNGYQADLVQNLGKIARTEITAAVRAGVVGELAPGQVMSRIKAFLAVPERDVQRYGSLAYQAERVVRTETMRVFNAANEASSRFIRGRLGDEGFIEVWNHSSLPGSRLNHAALDGFAVKAGAKFTVAGVQCSGPHDPALPAGEVINCRCTKFLWNERWGPVPRGPRPQGTAFFDSARAKRNGWTRGDRVAGLGSAGPGHGGADFGKDQGKGPGPIPPPPPVTPPPPIVPPPPPTPIPPAIAPKPPGQVVVGNPAAAAPKKPRAKKPAAYPSGAEVRKAITAKAAEYDRRIDDVRAEVQALNKEWIDYLSPSDRVSYGHRIGDIEAQIDRHRRELERDPDPDRPGGKGPLLRQWIARDEAELGRLRGRVAHSERVDALGLTAKDLHRRYDERSKDLRALIDERREALQGFLKAKNPMSIAPEPGHSMSPEEREAHSLGVARFGEYIDGRAWSGRYVPGLRNGRPGQTQGDGTPDNPFRVKFHWFADRASYDPGDDHIEVDGRMRTIVHELGHWFEEHHPAVHRAAVDFLMTRSADSPAKTAAVRRMQAFFPGRNYRDDEVTFEDAWKGLRGADDDGLEEGERSGSIYAGKLYSWAHQYELQHWVATKKSLTAGLADFNERRRERGDPPIELEDFLPATEIVSMGLEAFVLDPAKFAESDPDYFDLIWGISKGTLWP